VPLTLDLLADLGSGFEDELVHTLDRAKRFLFRCQYDIEGNNLHRFIDALWPLLPPGSLRDRLGPHLARSILSRPSPFLDPERTERVGLPAPRSPRRSAAPAPLVDLRFLRLELRGVRVVGDLDLDLCQESTLGGRWTCLVGLNGAGKTTILQCLAVLLLGPSRALDLGANAIAALRSPEASVATLTLHISLDGRPLRIGLRLSNGGTIEPLEEYKADWPQARQALERALVCAYGASRNLGGDDAVETDESRSVEARRLRSLFDSRALIPSAERLRAIDGLDSDHQRLFTEVVEAAMEDYGVKVHTDRRGTTFSIEGQSSVRASVLPDGFRATVAWINDLCRQAIERAGPLGAPMLKSQDLRGLVIIDEIDLHLHARMQRTIVARLRKALPNLTWLVTTHSPLVISAFDKAELRVLDRAAPGRLRPVDRQVYGFSLNDIVDMLLDPDAPGDWESKPLEDLREEVRKAGRDASQELRDRLILAQEVSAKIDEDEAWRRIYLRRSRGRRENA
jgi:predicted ATP-binding protein involved in virulence